jgi:hypothetical protein
MQGINRGEGGLALVAWSHAAMHAAQKGLY